MEASIQQVAGSVAVDSGHWVGIAQTQVVKLIDVRVRPSGGVHLVYRQHHRLSRALEHPSHLLVGGGHAGLDVAHENDYRGGRNGNFRLLPHEGQDLVVCTRLNAAGIHQVKGPSPPFRLGVQAVPSDAGGVLHDGQALSSEFIK